MSLAQAIRLEAERRGTLISEELHPHGQYDTHEDQEVHTHIEPRMFPSASGELNQIGDNSSSSDTQLSESDEGIPSDRDVGKSPRVDEEAEPHLKITDATPNALALHPVPLVIILSSLLLGPTHGALIESTLTAMLFASPMGYTLSLCFFILFFLGVQEVSLALTTISSQMVSCDLNHLYFESKETAIDPPWPQDRLLLALWSILVIQACAFAVTVQVLGFHDIQTPDRSSIVYGIVLFCIGVALSFSFAIGIFSLVKRVLRLKLPSYESEISQASLRRNHILTVGVCLALSTAVATSDVVLRDGDRDSSFSYAGGSLASQSVLFGLGAMAVLKQVRYAW